MSQRVVVTDHTFPDLRYEEATARDHKAAFAAHSCAIEEEAARAVVGADVALVNFAPVTRSVLAALNIDATVIRYGVGYDNVDIEAARELGIQVANVPDYGISTVADHAAASLLALARRLPVYSHRVREDGWMRPGDAGPVKGFRSMTVGLVGLGRIAQEVHTRLVPYGFSFVAHDPFAPPEIFEQLSITSLNVLELAELADAISLHAPSTPATYHLVDEEFLRRVQPGTVLVNTARGPLVDLQALLAALEDGRLAGAALDVTEPEPLPADSSLRDRPEVILSPHAAFYDEDSVRALQRLASEEAGRALSGEPLRCPVT